jgi:hypothetical protein
MATRARHLPPMVHRQPPGGPIADTRRILDSRLRQLEANTWLAVNDPGDW